MTRNQASFSVRIYPGKWGKFGHPQNLQNPHRNPYKIYSDFLRFLKFQNILLGVVFSVRDGPRGHENKYIEVILKHCSVILAISNFDVF